MNDEKNKIIYSNKLTKFIRFCKDNNLYHYIKTKYDSINTLNNAIKLLFVENYILGIFNYIPSKYIEQYNLDEYHIKDYDLKWKEYAKNMIEDERNEKYDFFKCFYNINFNREFSSINDELYYLEDLFFFHG